MGMILQFPLDDSLDEELRVGTGITELLLFGFEGFGWHA